MKWVLFLGLLTISGCQQMVWYSPDATPEQTRQDLAEAQRDAALSAYAPQPVSYVVVTDNSQQAAADAAASELGAAIGTAIKQAMIVNSEMQQKGYRLITVEEEAKLETDNANRPYNYAPPPPVQASYNDPLPGN